ncbi:MAG TPA: hypothetical protein PKD11_10095 [Pyrinomonadaceae bacterium]|nr:hypothetical protein [Pyrinomonadaceae bacterium]
MRSEKAECGMSNAECGIEGADVRKQRAITRVGAMSGPGSAAR